MVYDIYVTVPGSHVWLSAAVAGKGGFKCLFDLSEKRKCSAIICNLKNNSNFQLDKMAYNIKRSNDAFVILHNGSAFCSLAFWFLELQHSLDRGLIPWEKNVTSETTPVLKSVWNDTILKCRKQWFLWHSIIPSYWTQLCSTRQSCEYGSPSFTHGTGMREHYIQWGREGAEESLKKQDLPLQAMYVFTLKH